MDLLPLHFRTFQFFGFWYDEPRSKRLVKLLYRTVVMLLIVHLTLFQMIALFSERRTIDEYANTLFLALTFFVHICKALVFMAQRGSVERLLDMFREEVCRARDTAEGNILAEYLRRANWIYKARTNLTLCSGTINALAPLLVGCFVGKVELPWATYFFDVADPLQFTLVYVLQTLAIYAAIITDVCLDSTPCAFMILTCGQLELCCHRMRRDNNAIKSVESTGDEIAEQEESTIFKECARHHAAIQKIVQQMQNAFIPIILPIFSSALLTLCGSVFQLAQKNHSISEYSLIIVYLCCLLLQIYLFCWFGNELQLKGELVTDEVYKIDWTRIKPKTRRNYWYIMFMAGNKLVISFHGQCTLSLQTFIWMIKTSYGAFNLLSQVSDA